MRSQQSYSTLPRWHQWLMGLIVGVGLIGIWWNLGRPDEYVFDERYHVPAARAVLKADWRIFDWWQPPMASDGTYADWLHPPLFKYFQAGAIFLFGDKPWAWRLPSALAATFSLWLVWKIGLILADKKIAWLGVSLLSLSGLFLVQARTGMNDMVAVSLSLAGIFFYTRHRWKISQANLNLTLTGLFLGLALATKWSGLWTWLGIVSYEFVWELKTWWAIKSAGRIKKNNWQRNFQLTLPIKIVSFWLIPGLIYLMSFWPIFSSGNGLKHFINLHQNIWQYHVTRDKLHPDQSNPVEWLLNLQPVHYWQATVTPVKTTARISTLENPLLSVGLVVTLSWWLWQILGAKKTQKLKNLGQINWLGWLFLAMWLPSFFSPRILFQYHFLPAMTVAMLLVSSILANRPKIWQWLAWVLVLGLMSWLIFYPNWTGLPVSLWLAEKVYWLLPSWR